MTQRKRGLLVSLGMAILVYGVVSVTVLLIGIFVLLVQSGHIDDPLYEGAIIYSFVAAGIGGQIVGAILAAITLVLALIATQVVLPRRNCERELSAASSIERQLQSIPNLA